MVLPQLWQLLLIMLTSLPPPEPTTGQHALTDCRINTLTTYRQKMTNSDLHEQVELLLPTTPAVLTQGFWLFTVIYGLRAGDKVCKQSAVVSAASASSCPVATEPCQSPRLERLLCCWHRCLCCTALTVPLSSSSAVAAVPPMTCASDLVITKAAAASLTQCSTSQASHPNGFVCVPLRRSLDAGRDLPAELHAAAAYLPL